MNEINPLPGNGRDLLTEEDAMCEDFGAENGMMGNWNVDQPGQYGVLLGPEAVGGGRVVEGCNVHEMEHVMLYAEGGQVTREEGLHEAMWVIWGINVERNAKTADAVLGRVARSWGMWNSSVVSAKSHANKFDESILGLDSGVRRKG